jgi:serine/threonine-protein kinase
VAGTSPADVDNAVGLLPVWIGRDGSVTVIDPEWRFNPGNNNRGISLSPDGSRVVLNMGEGGSPGQNIWVKQLPRGPFNPITSDPVENVRPTWAEDGRHIYYISRRGGHPDANQQADVWRTRADGIGDPELVLDHSTNIWEVDFAPGGEWLAARVGGQINQIGARDVAIRGPDHEMLQPVIASDADEKAIAISPDGRWLAYESDDTGTNEIYVRPFPNVDDGRFPVSQRGGTMPKWAHGSNELFFVDGSRTMMAAHFDTAGGVFRVTELEMLFPLPDDIFYNFNEHYALYDVAPDDQRFIWMRSTLNDVSFDTMLLEDWAVELEPGGN